MRYGLLAILVISCLASCSQINSVVTMDASGAIAIATAEGTPAALARIVCYKAIDALPLTQVKGVLSLYEVTQGAQDLSQGPCAPVIAGVAVQVLQHTPIVVPIP